MKDSFIFQMGQLRLGDSDPSKDTSPVRSCAEPNMSFISKLPPISASSVASVNMWPFIRNFMGRGTAYLSIEHEVKK
ncbi:hypothetical protein D623_10020738 [Myotis brandtii]|uniref:Uncharacterized protein n=1 Tax=Myotis brandtii TaxID=109478 RepID=S7NA41_MYOBR|nr:hypothetical protein D623_10020738 [Myotis brandtii]